MRKLKVNGKSSGKMRTKLSLTFNASKLDFSVCIYAFKVQKEVFFATQ